MYPKIFSPGVLLAFLLSGCTSHEIKTPDNQQLSQKYFGNDAEWYFNNIPFFECSDKNIEAVYYYRWKMYKAHIRNTGTDHFVITEFINDVHWDIDPYSTINAASGHHIYEGRWLRDDRYMKSYITYLNQEGGNNRSYSEWIADATYAHYLVKADSTFLVSQLDGLKKNFDGWNDHWEEARKLYFIPAMPDATEYNIASIDATGGTEGFAGGDAFRPTFNSYMYGNAAAISKIAALKNDDSTSKEYLAKAISLKNEIQQSLWNPELHHFTDRYKQDNKYVHYWDFIRGRELAGMIPWVFDLPEDNPKYNQAWKHVLDTTRLLGPYGFRTNEPSYEYYFKQFVFNFGKRGSQWNGPSWPFQSSHVLTAMANFLNDYDQHIVTTSDYLKVLRLYTMQHYLPNGDINFVENYDPDKGGPIVHFRWSNHYNHSTYNNLIITGLCGIRPSEGDSLVINPLIDPSIKYFFLNGVKYRGHDLAVIYDADGSKYNAGVGLTILIDGEKAELINTNGKYKVNVGAVRPTISVERSENYALNIRRAGFPKPDASINTVADSIYQAVDGRIWYFPEITNYWSTEGSRSDVDWLSVDFGEPRNLFQARIYFYTDGTKFKLPDSVRFEYEKDGEWKKLDDAYLPFKGNTCNVIKLDATASKIKVYVDHRSGQVAIGEVEFY